MKMYGIGWKELPKLSELNPGMEALGYKVMVLPREFEEQTAGGVFVAKTVDGNVAREEEAGSEGMVASLGDWAGSERWPPGHIKPGDTIIFSRYAGKHSEFTGADGRTYRFMNDEDIIGVRRQAEAVSKAA